MSQKDGYEVLTDQSEAEALRVARLRAKRIYATPEEQKIYRCSPASARSAVDRPGMPDDDYGDMTGG